MFLPVQLPQQLHLLVLRVRLLSFQNVPVSSGGVAMDVGTTLGPVVQGRAMSYQSSSTPTCTSIPDGSIPSSTPGQSGPMLALPDLTGRGQNNASPRGGRRKAAGLFTRSQGTTCKQRQQTVDQLAVAAAAAQQQQQQMGSAVGCVEVHLSSLHTRAPGLLAHSKQVYRSSSHLGLQRLHLVRKQHRNGYSNNRRFKNEDSLNDLAKATSASCYSSISETVNSVIQVENLINPTKRSTTVYRPPQYGGNMIMKVETGANSMQMVDHTQQQQQQQQQQQHQYAQQQQLIQMQQDVQGGSQYVLHQQQRGGIAYG
ncbi:Uncharacterized protein BM_BM594 [Brugia malayi]|uniref:Bm594, isoform c; Bm594, isoform h; Bm594, isoform j; Bm594, isoform j n=1 Tax=Brugia malayi TaxID=6279 RepID=A0A1P6C780_BRUMA|nr:Uncharacterized protein BM_BM594 [Brugia malayi]CDP98863.1 Bm594, isoform i [Brugia malayi]VIO98080.1 Uncharacterized protein BM_BM594 [Brugia malayi]